jgi:S-methylmethionine-dependent homocysteine/selenocysteine methylase
MALHHVGGLRISGGFDADKFYVLDGGFATRLNIYSPESVSGPLWGCGAIHTDPEAVVRVHEDYLKAGANIITTNTYQCSPEAFAANLKLDEPGLDEYLLFEKAVQLADEAIKRVHSVPRYALVAGSVGPYGAVLCDGSEYSGSYVDSMSEQQLEQWHFERIKRLAVGQVDILAVSNM